MTRFDGDTLRAFDSPLPLLGGVLCERTELPATASIASFCTDECRWLQKKYTVSSLSNYEQPQRLFSGQIAWVQCADR